MFMSDIGDYIQTRLKILGIKQYELAERIDKSPSLVNDWIKGERIPPFDQIETLASALEERNALELYKKAGYLDNFPNVDILQILQDLSSDEMRIVRNMLKAFVEAKKHG